MHDAGKRANRFYREVAHRRAVWTVRETTRTGESQYPAPQTASGGTAQPFWSSYGRAAAFVDSFSPPRSRFHIERIGWDEFRSRWVPLLEQQARLMGINWERLGANENLAEKPSDVRLRVEDMIEATRVRWELGWFLLPVIGAVAVMLLNPRMLLVQHYGRERVQREHLTIVDASSRSKVRVSNGDTIDGRYVHRLLLLSWLACGAVAIGGYTLTQRGRKRRAQRVN